MKDQNREVNEIGLKALLEPNDYSDYVMLDILNGCGELVVNSRQIGYICTDPNLQYTPGVRLYFDAHKIINAGIGVRDGLHILKVFESISLDHYLIMKIDLDDFENKQWTPSTFTEESNRLFLAFVERKRYS